jgi:hypothetical protein
MPYSKCSFLLIAIVYACTIDNVSAKLFISPTSSDQTYVAYDRKLYKHWIDEDRDCQDTRQEVLISESIELVMLDERGCKVISGLWNDPFTGNIYTDPSDLDIDHMIPLKEVHVSGGYDWSAARREQYANDISNPDVLIAVNRSANRSKGARDVAHWLPTNEAFSCEYVRRWVAVKEAWGLTMDDVETERVLSLLGDC